MKKTEIDQKPTEGRVTFVSDHLENLISINSALFGHFGSFWAIFGHFGEIGGRVYGAADSCHFGGSDFDENLLVWA